MGAEPSESRTRACFCQHCSLICLDQVCLLVLDQSHSKHAKRSLGRAALLKHERKWVSGIRLHRSSSLLHSQCCQILLASSAFSFLNILPQTLVSRHTFLPPLPVCLRRCNVLHEASFSCCDGVIRWLKDAWELYLYSATFPALYWFRPSWAWWPTFPTAVVIHVTISQCLDLTSAAFPVGEERLQPVVWTSKTWRRNPRVA